MQIIWGNPGPLQDQTTLILEHVLPEMYVQSNRVPTFLVTLSAWAKWPECERDTSTRHTMHSPKQIIYNRNKN